MTTNNLLYKDSYSINDKISVRIPSVGEILDNEDNYNLIISILTSMPIDMMVQLDDMGIAFDEIDDYELFLLLFPALQSMDASIVFGDLDLSLFSLAVDQVNGQMVLIDAVNDIKIDKAIYHSISALMRKINNISQDLRRPGNAEAKEYMIERERKKQRRRKNKKRESQLESLIIAMVNTEQFKYDFCTVRQLSIYMFNESVRQIIKKVEYSNRMYGVYAGTINAKDLSRDDLNWLVH